MIDNIDRETGEIALNLEELEAMLMQAPCETEGEQAEQAPAPRWVPRTRQDAESILRKLAAIEAEEALVKAQAESILTDLRKRRERLMGYCSAFLEDFARNNLPKGSKSVKLLHGTLQLVSRKARLDVTDEDAAKAAAQSLPACWSQPAPRFLKGVYLEWADQVMSAGEPAPGVEIIPAGDDLRIKFPKAGEGQVDE